MTSSHYRLIRPTNPFSEFKKHEIEQSIADRFEQIVTLHSHRLAVKTPGHELTYNELNEFSNRIAHALLANFETKEEPVAILMQQGAPLIAAILGILKAGKIYVPIDPSHPTSRIEYILQDARAALIVTDNTNLSLSRAFNQQNERLLLNVDALESGLSTANPAFSVSPDSSAYIFFTSGSTGRPKGVVDNHRNVLHNIMRYTNSLHICTDDRLTLLQSSSFSGSVSSLFSSLLNGASVFPYDLVRDGMGNTLANWLNTEKITIYHSVPMIFRSFVTGAVRFPSIRIIRLEGDAASKVDFELYRKHFEDECLLVNGLGATETGICRQYFIDKKAELSGSTLPIGYPVEDMHVLLLDDEGRETNSIGEIAVKSKYLAVGYWRNPELTAAAFSTDSAPSSERTYRTGDMGRMHPDGCLEYLGRKDFQLKIRGHRVETAEVERALVNIQGIKEAVVSTREDRPGEPRLVAHLVTSSSPAPNVSTLRQSLMEQVPDFMIPSAFVFMDAIPLDANGKIDRRALPAPEDGKVSRSTNLVAARNIIEQQLMRIWKEVLGVDNISVTDNFFELGGDSLRAAHMLTELETIISRNFPLTILLETPTIEGLARCVRNEGWSTSSSSLVALQPNGHKPPFFLIHRAGGHLLVYRDLIKHMSPDQPLYGLQAQGLNGDKPLHSRVEMMAAHYIEEIQKVQKQGPYLLGGSSFGGKVAFEMARQLHTAGQRVSFVALFDTSLTSDEKPARGVLWLARQSRVHARQLFSLPAKERAPYLRERIRTIKNMLLRNSQSTSGSEKEFNLQSIVETFYRASEMYKPGKYPGRLTLFRGSDARNSEQDDPTLGWGKWAGGGVELYDVPGTHLSMLEEPHAKVLAEHLTDCLNKQ